MLSLDKQIDGANDAGVDCPDILIIDEESSDIVRTLENLDTYYTTACSNVMKNITDAAEKDNCASLIIVSADNATINPFHVLMRLKQSKRTDFIPIVMITQKDNIEEKIRAFSLGCDDYITLPIRDDELTVRIASKIRNQERQKAMKRLAYQDELTGLVNRRGYNEALSLEWARCKRSQKPISMLLVDIDNFKIFNDEYGHHIGDQLIQATAQALKNVFHRTTDVLARYGGDEFVFLLPDCEFSGCVNIANMILNEFKGVSEKVLGEDSLHQASISIGIASTTPRANNSTAWLFEQADKALYAAKAKGKNCWQIA